MVAEINTSAQCYHRNALLLYFVNVHTEKFYPFTWLLCRKTLGFIYTYVITCDFGRCNQYSSAISCFQISFRLFSTRMQRCVNALKCLYAPPKFRKQGLRTCKYSLPTCKFRLPTYICNLGCIYTVRRYPSFGCATNHPLAGPSKTQQVVSRSCFTVITLISLDRKKIDYLNR